jgi:hypothetical protein
MEKKDCCKYTEVGEGKKIFVEFLRFRSYGRYLIAIGSRRIE